MVPPFMLINIQRTDRHNIPIQSNQKARRKPFRRRDKADERWSTTQRESDEIRPRWFRLNGYQKDDTTFLIQFSDHVIRPSMAHQKASDQTMQRQNRIRYLFLIRSILSPSGSALLFFLCCVILGLGTFITDPFNKNATNFSAQQ